MTTSKDETSLPRPAAHPLRWAAIALTAALTLVGLPVGAAQAHHGFDDFDTGRLYYLSGTVSQVRWGDPHSYFTLSVDGDLPADTPELTLPEQLQAPEDSGPINEAPSYPGRHDTIEVVIAPPSYTGRWGLQRPLRDGETVEAVGYIGRSHDDEFRPVVFWFEDGRPVNQVLGNQLPARPLPLPYPENGSSAQADINDSGATADGAEGTSSVVVWGLVGGALIVIVGGGILYLRRSHDRRQALGDHDG